MSAVGLRLTAREFAFASLFRLFAGVIVAIVVREFTVDAESGFADARADRCVQMLAGGSRAFVNGLFDHDCVQLNGALLIDPGKRLQAGDGISVRFEQGRKYSPRRRPEENRHRGFSVVYEDRELIVVDKAADLLTVPTDAREPYTLVYRVNEHVRREGHRRGAFVVHRLDLGVSGLLVFGKTREAADALQQQFRERKPNRRYDALVAGTVADDSGCFRSFLGTAKNLNRYSTRESDETELAVTHFEVVARVPGDTRASHVVAAPLPAPRTNEARGESHTVTGLTHVAVRLETGRRNQIRIHFAEAGHPVLGDRRYGDRTLEVNWVHKRLALHASTLGFLQPATGRPVEFSSPLPAEMLRLLNRVSRKR